LLFSPGALGCLEVFKQPILYRKLAKYDGTDEESERKNDILGEKEVV